MADAPPTFTLCHAIPGRLRVKVTAIRRAAEEADVLAYWLAKLPGIRKAQANPLTGSVILHYDPQATSPPAISKSVLEWLWGPEAPRLPSLRRILPWQTMTSAD